MRKLQHLGGLDGATTVLLIDGARTEASAEALSDVMANDKKHLAFARQLLSGRTPDMVLLTGAGIVGGASHTMPASSLKEVWVATAQEQGTEYQDISSVSGAKAPERAGACAPSSSS